MNLVESRNNLLQLILSTDHHFSYWHKENFWQLNCCVLPKNFIDICHCLSKKKFKFFILTMKTASNELQKLRSMAESSLNKTAELQQVLAQIEASLSRAESQKVLEKENKN